MDPWHVTHLQTDWIDPPAATAHERVGFELGWDYAHYAQSPAAPHDSADSALRQGWRAGQATFGARTLKPAAGVHRWLQLRLHAWLRGRSVELMQVTPNYLHQLEVRHCPITRLALAPADPQGVAASIDRVRNDAGYAAGNLAVLSAQANRAKGASRHDDVARLVHHLQSQGRGAAAGLSLAQWRRVAVLTSFVEPLPHGPACALPMLVLPPNRLRLFNPVQALQAFVSVQWLTPGWSQRIGRFEDLLAGAAVKRDFKRFFVALLPRLIEASARAGAAPASWAVEDAWQSPLVLARWTRFAQALTPTQCESLLERAAARRLSTKWVLPHTASEATAGWNLPTQGYVPSAVRPHARVATPLAC